MIVVTGGTGQLGRAIARALVSRMPAAEVAVTARDPAKASALAALGIEVRHGDFAQPATLAAAFAGASQLLLVSSNARAHGGDPLAQHRAAIDAARAAGVNRIVYTSHMAASARSAFLPMHEHAATEEMLARSGLAWTALRNGFYASSGLAMMGAAFTTGVARAPRDGKVSWTAHADLAEAAAVILQGEGQLDGPTPPLTGAEALDFADIAGLASAVLGRVVRREEITDEALESGMAAGGVPETIRAIAGSYYRASRAGEFAAVDPTLARLLGRPPTSMQHVLAEKLETR